MKSKARTEDGGSGPAGEAHWDEVYRRRDSQELTWHQETPAASLELLDACGIGPSQGVIDVGGGTSRFTRALLSRGFKDLTVLDISGVALERQRRLLGSEESAVTLIHQDVTEFKPARTWHVWHDRAVFHFLTEEDRRGAYRAVVESALVEGGFAVISTFALDGPERCSGLSVQRYDPHRLLAALGSRFQLVRHLEELHVTPRGGTQSFVYTVLRYLGPAGSPGHGAGGL